MKFLKKIGKKLFGSPKPKKIVRTKKKIARKKISKPVRKKTTKSSKKKVGKKSAAKGRSRMVRTALAAMPIAEVTHYFPHVNAAVLKIKTGEIRIGDELRFKGHTTDFKQRVVSMQIDHQPVQVAKKGDDFGVEVNSKVRAGDLVFKK